MITHDSWAQQSKRAAAHVTIQLVRPSPPLIATERAAAHAASMEALLERDIELACVDGSLPFSSHLLALASPVLEPAIGLLKDSQDKVLAMPDGTAATWTVIRDHVDPRVPHSQKAQVAWVGGQHNRRLPVADCCMVQQWLLARCCGGWAAVMGYPLSTCPRCPPPPSPRARRQSNVKAVLELADKYNMPMVLSVCEMFLSRSTLETKPGRANDVVEWLVEAERLGLDETVAHCLKFVRDSTCLKEIQFIKAGYRSIGSCGACGCRDWCLRYRLFNKQYLAQLKPSTLVQLLMMGSSA